MRPDLSIVIVGYNTRQLLLDCLASIYRTAGEDQSPEPPECLVVDNASTDGSVEAIRAQFPQVRLIANAHNVYFSAANNQGIQQASGRYVLVMNPDMVVKGDTLVQLVRQMDADPSIGAATTSTFFPDGRLQRNGSHFSTFGYLVFNYTFVGKLLVARQRAYNEWLWYAGWDRTTRRDIDILPGCCIIALKDTWTAVGGFDAGMLHYFSDEYFSRAVQRLGKRTVYLISDGIIHYEGKAHGR